MQQGDIATFTFLLAFRLVNALCVRTFFQPDEYFQALEPAWSIAFGPDSGAWLTWEWQHQLRSSLHPLLFGAVYLGVDCVSWLLRLHAQHRAAALVMAPKCAQALFAAIGDYYTWKLAHIIHKRSPLVAAAALWLTVLNPWQWYCSTRTFSNSIETTLTAMALRYWPWYLIDGEPKKRGLDPPNLSLSSLRKSLLLAALATILRPTNALIWLAILTLMLTRLSLDGTSPLTRNIVANFAVQAVACGAAVLAVSLVSDRFFFGFWTFPPLKWLHFNISQDLAVFYGRNDWHYYLTQGIPLLTTTSLPFVAWGLYKSIGLAAPSNAVRTLSFAVFASIGALSAVSHKEVRFIYPLLPILHVIAAPYICTFFLSGNVKSASSAPRPSAPVSVSLRRKPLLASLVALNIAVGGYMSLFHQPAPLSVVTFLRQEYERLHPGYLMNRLHSADNSTLGGRRTDQGGNELFVLFLMPCHSTPWRSHLVYPGLRARALTCEPPLHTEPGSREREEYMDEADRFYAEIASFLGKEIWPTHTSHALKVPRYVVGFERIEEQLLHFFKSQADAGSGSSIVLRRAWEGWNGYFNEDPRRRGNIIVWELQMVMME